MDKFPTLVAMQRPSFTLVQSLATRADSPHLYCCPSPSLPPPLALSCYLASFRSLLVESNFFAFRIHTNLCAAFAIAIFDH